MLMKKSAFAICSSGSFHSTFCVPPSWTSPCTANSSTPTTAGQSQPSRPRLFATVLHGDDFPKHENHDDAKQKKSHGSLHLEWPLSAHPTPYEIFSQTKGAPYNKTRFYELVKLYHPDRHHHTVHHGLSRATKLERYRLVVAANNILCDPTKRRAYDLYGAGWAGQSDMQNDFRTAEQAWRQRPGNAAMNATWEDWERWYEQQRGGGAAKEKQMPVFMSNQGFLAVIILFVCIGSWAQSTRAGSNSLHILEMRDQRHRAISQELRRQQSETATLSKEARVESFLERREGWGYGPQSPTAVTTPTPASAGATEHSMDGPAHSKTGT